MIHFENVCSLHSACHPQSAVFNPQSPFYTDPRHYSDSGTQGNG